MLPDVLERNLNLVICGTAAGKRSGELTQYYAGRGNKFWKVLYSTGLTEEELDSSRYPELTNYGIGLTDVVKGQSGMDREINFSKSSELDLYMKIKYFSPKVLCFNGKKSAQVFFGIQKIDFGVYPQKVHDSICFVAPSTSGAANGSWDLESWQNLAELVTKKSI